MLSSAVCTCGVSALFCGEGFVSAGAARELAGMPCLELDERTPPMQEICCNRMFGKRLKELPPIKEAVAKINGRWGRGTLRAASVPTSPDWAMRREMMSQSYTTRIDQLWTADCR